MLMTKKITLIVDGIKKANDKPYIFDIYSTILTSLNDYFGTASNIFFDKTEDSFIIKFTLKVCRTGDMLWILFKELLQCIRESEDKVDISISEVEQNGLGTVYKLYKYKANE